MAWYSCQIMQAAISLKTYSICFRGFIYTCVVHDTVFSIWKHVVNWAAWRHWYHDFKWKHRDEIHSETGRERNVDMNISIVLYFYNILQFYYNIVLILFILIF